MLTSKIKEEIAKKNLLIQKIYGLKQERKSNRERERK